jgi:hypothetical protein
VNTVAVTPEAQVNVDPEIPQFPFDDFSVKPDPEAVAVIVAHVPPTYHVPALIKHPFVAPPDTALR